MVWRDQIPDYLNEDFYQALAAWSEFRTFGLPYSGGYREQPCQWVDAVMLFETLWKQHDAEMQEKAINASKRRTKNRNPRRSR